MRHSWRGCYGAVVAATLSLVIGCKDAPPAPEASTNASDSPLMDAEREASGSQIPFSILKMFFEFNSTDNDLGVQVLLDAEDWERVRAFDPGSRQILQITAHGRLQQLGLTELFFESAEPSPEEVLGLFPAGNYRFVGKTVDNNRLVGTATLSHNLPPAPSFSPSNGELVDRNNVVITWSPIPGIVGFQLIVGNSELGVEMIIDLKPSVTSLKVPPEFLETGTEYKVEVLAIAANRNKTITEGTFNTMP